MNLSRISKSKLLNLLQLEFTMLNTKAKRFKGMANARPASKQVKAKVKKRRKTSMVQKTKAMNLSRNAKSRSLNLMELTTFNGTRWSKELANVRPAQSQVEKKVRKLVPNHFKISSMIKRSMLSPITTWTVLAVLGTCVWASTKRIGACLRMRQSQKTL